MQPSRNNNGQTPKQGERKPFNKTPQTTPRVNDRGGQNGKMPGRDKQKDVSFKNPSDDKKGTPRANMVSDKENIQAAKRYAGFHSKRTGTFNLYQAGEDQEMQEEEDTGYHSYFMQSDSHHHGNHIEMNIMWILVMTQDELDQAHDTFMITVRNG